MKKKQTQLARVITPEVVSEIIPRSPAEMKALLQQLVAQQVTEVLAARDQFILEPWFRTATVSREIRKLQTVQERNAWPLHFERHGCIHCRTKKHPHAALGFCTPCYQKITQQKRDSVRELTEAYDREKRTPRELGKLAENCLRPIRADKGKE